MSTCGDGRDGKPPTAIHPDPRKTLAYRLGRYADRFRFMEQRFGLRNIAVSLVWTKWTGEERGEGYEQVIRVMEIAPMPIIEEGGALSNNPRSAGILPEGTIRVSGISSYYPMDLLDGKLMPCDPAGMRQAFLTNKPYDAQSSVFAMEEVPHPWSFFWELQDDGRTDARLLPRGKYRISSGPTRRVEKFDWMVVLDKISEDRSRHGKTRPGPDEGIF